jgi:hypothetical protein
MEREESWKTQESTRWRDTQQEHYEHAHDGRLLGPIVIHVNAKEAWQADQLLLQRQKF